MPRQNGKNIVLEVIELVAVFALGERLVIHSAHRADISHEHFLALEERIRACDDLFDQMPNTRNRGFVSANGKESIVLKNGNRILFKARGGGKSGRGPRPQRLVFDEALVLDLGAVGAMAPGMIAQPNPQVVFASSPPVRDSAMLHDLRRRAEAAEEDDRLFYAAWNNEPGTKTGDVDAHYRVNPSLGYGRMTIDSVTANRRLMDDADYLREHLGVPDAAPTDVEHSVIAKDAWKDCHDPAVERGPVTYAVEVDRDGIAAAITASDGTLGLVLGWDRGSSWLPGRLADKLAKRPGTVWLDPRGPAGVLISELARLGIDFEEITNAQRAQAWAEFKASVHDRSFRHLGQPVLDIAARKVTERSIGDVLVPDRRDSDPTLSISPVSGVSIARWAARQAPADKPTFAY